MSRSRTPAQQRGTHTSVSAPTGHRTARAAGCTPLGWLSPNRPAAVTGTVQPGSTYTFVFPFAVGNTQPTTTPTSFTEAFNLVEDSVAWFSNADLLVRAHLTGRAAITTCKIGSRDGSPSISVPTSDVSRTVGEPTTFAGIQVTAGAPNATGTTTCTWDGRAQPPGSPLPYDVAVIGSISSRYPCADAANAQFLADSESLQTDPATTVLGAVDTPLGDGAFSWTTDATATASSALAGTQSVEVLAGDRIVIVGITSLGLDQRAHGQQEFLARLIIGQLAQGAANSNSGTSNSGDRGTMTRDQFTMEANTLCRLTSAQIPDASAASDMNGLADTVRASLATYPEFLRQVAKLIATQPNRADLESNWLRPMQSDFDAAQNLGREFVSAVEGGNADQASELLQQIADAPDHRSQVEDTLNQIGLAECVALEAK